MVNVTFSIHSRVYSPNAPFGHFCMIMMKTGLYAWLLLCEKSTVYEIRAEFCIRAADYGINVGFRWGQMYAHTE